MKVRNRGSEGAHPLIDRVQQRTKSVETVVDSLQVKQGLLGKENKEKAGRDCNRKGWGSC